jgi:[acyl-carrier-protein] S-malonyltransferase
MTIAFIFPGQGSQAVGMGKDLFDASPVARQVFEEVDEALGQKLTSLIFEGPIGDLTLTENAQPALMAVSIAAARVLEAQSGRSLADLGQFVAGHSLGEYSALTAVGALQLSDAAKLLKLRGQAMQAAVPVGEGAMAAILGLDIDQVISVAEASAGDGVCEVANDNAPGQIVVSGSKEAVDRAAIAAKEAGAKRALLLPVSAPFHCSMMQPAAERMAEALASTLIAVPSMPVVTNVSTEPQSDPEVIRNHLVAQVTGRVRWSESVQAMAGNGVTELIEIGAGKVLSGMARRIVRELTGSALNSSSDIDTFLAR